MKSLGIEKIPTGGLADYSNGFHERRFSPYSDNGGSVVAIAGEDYAVVASDTRLSGHGTTGCWCDILTFCKVAEMRIKTYYHTHNTRMATPAVAQMTSTMLYHKRFFPYYISNILAGLDNEGKGVVYSYDPVGHCEKNMYRAGGSACTLLQPLLDNQVGKKNMAGVDKTVKISMEDAISIIHDVFISAAEREIHTGDGLCFNIITKDGIRVETLPLRRD